MKKLIITLLMMLTLSACSNKVSLATSVSITELNAGAFTYIKRGYNINGESICIYSKDGKQIHMLSDDLDSTGARRCPKNLINAHAD